MYFLVKGVRLPEQTVDVTSDESADHVIVLEQLRSADCRAVMLSNPEYAKETSDSTMTRILLRRPLKLDPVIVSFVDAFRVTDCDLPSSQIE